ncbi:LacI family DNA-binding transcriptional regulator [Cryptosporangium aurantiacum]|uniref:Transcriptional regulator, LacI family n=1 Tax=Cryptosporangium aurantiacum TaxID=134849 RepID=A0A1M7PDU6_9ACTN|nr:LacI family DNA-binding transcriptional regulator [Cryptosporangium aurantiacum]SHN14822.1 transcriptional regulator, LacI family [Cryptosporangium aurantiacum]
MTSGEPATMEDLARMAGVSVATVSRALSGKPGVSASTRSAIARLAREHRFTSNQSARALSTGQTGRVTVTLPRIEAEYFARILAGAAQVIHDAGLSLVLETTQHERDRQSDAIQGFVTSGVDGALILLPAESNQEISALYDSGFKFVIIDPIDQVTAPMPWVTSTHAMGARHAVEHLLGLGHRRIAMITGEPHFFSTKERLHGAREALERAGVGLDPDLVRVSGYTESAAAYDVAVDLLRHPDPPTAIFAFNDRLAFTTLQAAHALKIPVPDALSIVGFDDMEAAKLISPGLTTVRQPLAAMGSTAATMLIQLLNGQTPLGMHIQLATELVVRRSTGTPG